MTYKETILAIRGYENRQLRDWERTRLIAYQVYAGIPKKNQNKPITQYMPLPSDLRNKVTRSKEEMEAQRRFFIDKERNRKLKQD